jgi:hypothetical protein
MWSPLRPWSPIRQWLRAIGAIIALFDESLRFAIAIESDLRVSHRAGGPSTVTVRVRPVRDDAAREYGERAA